MFYTVVIEKDQGIYIEECNEYVDALLNTYTCIPGNYIRLFCPEFRSLTILTNNTIAYIYGEDTLERHVYAGLNYECAQYVLSELQRLDYTKIFSYRTIL